MSTTRKPPSNGLTAEQRRYACKAIDARFAIALRTIDAAKKPQEITELSAPSIESSNYRQYLRVDEDEIIEDAPKPILDCQAKLLKKVAAAEQAFQELISKVHEHNQNVRIKSREWESGKTALQLNIQNARDEAKLRTQLNGAGDELLEFLSEAVPSFEQLQKQAKALGIVIENEAKLLEAN